jgi:hypothetical protein
MGYLLAEAAVQAPNVLERALGILLEQGVIGVVVAALSFWIFRKDREHQSQLKSLQDALATESGARVDDAKGYATLAIDLQRDVVSATKTISDSIDETRTLAVAIERVVALLEK